MDRELLISYYVDRCSDLIPYDDPNYEAKVLDMATGLADADIAGDIPEFVSSSTLDI